MHFTFYIAKRYLFSKKKQNIINIISGISMVAVTVGTTAMIIVLSVFNGFEKVGTSFYSIFDPPIRVEAAKGKVFDMKNFPLKEIENIKGITGYVEVIEENALLKYGENQQIVNMKGVSDSFVKLTRLDTAMVKGHLHLTKQNADFAVLGILLNNSLGVNLYDYSQVLTAYLPKSQTKSTLSMDDFVGKNIIPAGAFQVPGIDHKYVIVPLRFMRQLLEYDKEVTAVEIYLADKANMHKIQKNVQRIVGEDFVVKNRFEQQALFYKAVKSEKLAIYIILSFILLIACFNATGSLSMLILEKKQDIRILQSMGLNHKKVKRIFFTEGMLISIIGGGVGLVLGFLICWLQQTFGIIKLGNNAESNFVISAFPIQLKALDFIMVSIIIVCIGWLSALFPCRKIKKMVE